MAPSPVGLSYLKWRLLDSGKHGFLIDFWTPGQLREHLLGVTAPGTRLALREELHLLMSAAAEATGASPSARSIAADPDEWVRAYDRMSAAGYGAGALERGDWRAIAKRYEHYQAESAVWRAQKADQFLCRDDSASGRVFPTLLMVGFSATHWANYFLLHAACRMAREAHVCFIGNRESRPEQVWIGSWEEAFGVIEPVPGSLPAEPRWSALTEALTMDERPEKETAPGILYRIGADVHEEARAIVAQAVEFLHEPGCKRLGIILPSNALLPREVSALLAHEDIPHHDGFGFYGAQPARQRLLNGWVVWQREPRLSRAATFLRLIRRERLLPGGEVGRIEQSLRAACDTLLTDDWEVVHGWLETREGAEEARRFCGLWPLLPPAETMRHFLDTSRESLSRMGWVGELGDLEDSASRFDTAIGRPIDRGIFLRWLHEVLRTPGKTRGALGREAFATVQLVSWRDAAGQAFTHTILGGLNHGRWPQEGTESPFLPDDLVESLNAAAVRTGSQGEGHLIVAPGKGYLLSGAEERALAMEAFIGILETDPEAIAVTASVATDEDGTRSGLVSDILLRLFWADRGEMLDDVCRDALREQTRLWLEGWGGPGGPATGKFDAMRHAFESRRDPQLPFGEFDYGFREPPPGGLRLSCKAWETALKRPASIWYEQVLHAFRPVRFSEPPAWNLAVGNWVHGWMRAAPDRAAPDRAASIPRPDTDQWLRIVEDHADELARSVGEAYRGAGREIPDWWRSTWAEALTGARSLVRALGGVAGWPYMAGEYRLPEGARASLPDVLDLPVTGRVDLLLSDGPLPEPGSEDADPESNGLWVVDFKTGKDSPLNLERLSKGDGLQLALYALALRQWGGDAIAVSVLRLEGDLEPQLDGAALSELPDLWIGIQSIQRHGILGQRGAIRSAYAFTGNYPVATLPVPPDVLELKWCLTHPNLAD